MTVVTQTLSNKQATRESVRHLFTGPGSLVQYTKIRDATKQVFPTRVRLKQGRNTAIGVIAPFVYLGCGMNQS